MDIDPSRLATSVKGSLSVFLKKVLGYAHLAERRYVALYDFDTQFIYEFDDDAAESGRLWVVPNEQGAESVRIILAQAPVVEFFDVSPKNKRLCGEPRYKLSIQDLVPCSTSRQLRYRRESR